MVLSRRTKDKLNPERKFSWFGDAILSKPGKNKKMDNTYYSGFELDNMKIEVGDCVCVSASATLSMSDYYVGRILECFDNGAETDSHRANIQWYSRIEEIPKNHHKYISKDYPEFDTAMELLKDLSPFANDTDIESITSKCHVTEVDSSVDPSTVIRPNMHAGHSFVCRFMYQRKKPWILPINLLEGKNSMECDLETEVSPEVELPIKLSNNKENINKKARRRTKILDDTSILKEINEENSQTEQQSLQKRTKDKEVRKGTPLKQKMHMVENKIASLSLRSPRKSTPIKHARTESPAKAEELEIPKYDVPTKSKETPLKQRLKMVEDKVSTLSLSSARKSTPGKNSRRASVSKSLSHELSKCDEVIKSNVTPLKKRLQMVEEQVSTLSLSSPRKATPMKKSRRSSVAKACEFELPKREVPLKANSTNFEVARSQLHVSAVPDSLPCRENEFQQIYSFVEGKLLDSIGGCLYVSGVPGTGKTATVNEVMNLLKEAQADGSVPAFDLLHINAMKLTKPHQLWVQMWKDISGEKVTADHAAKLLAKHLTKSAPKRKCMALILDELDLLWTKKQDVMYNLFDWSSQVGSKLIVVAIANTMDLPERIMISRVSSRLGLTRMTFQPYNFSQLQEIITARLCGVNAFEPDAIQFVARKVAALSGDARRALDICRRATEIAEHSSVEPSKKTKNSASKSSKAKSQIVGMEHVSKAIEEMFSSSMIKAISRCSRIEKIILQCIIAEFHSTGLEEAVFERVLCHVGSTCRFEGIRQPSSSQILALLQSLSSQRIVLAEHSRFDLMMRIRLNVSVDDINYAIQEKQSKRQNL